jgi:putative intracellular protease/amidase
VIVAGWQGGEVADIVSALAAFAGRDTLVTALCSGPVALAAEDVKRCRVDVKVGRLLR